MAIERRTDILVKRIKDLNNDAVEDLTLREINIREKALECPALKTKWLMILSEEKKYLKLLKKAKSKSLEDYVQNHGKIGVPKLLTSKDAEKQKEITNINQAISDQEEVVEFVEGIVKIFSNLNFDIKNSVDLIKIEST